MKVTLTRHSQRTTLTLEKEPFASGGEGNLYKIVSPKTYHKFVVKLYHQPKRTAKKEAKIQFLMNNPPNLNSGGHNSLVWVEGMIYDQKGFAGLLMPFARGEKLVILCTPKIPRKNRKEWGRFLLSSPNSLELRLKICFNIAAALYQLHETQRYVLVDLKPDNVIIQPNGLVSIVDIDSMEVLDNGRVLFPAPVVTPEFAPPEYYGEMKPGKKAILPTWDQFSMAAIFYKLLFGIHPFAGSCKPPYDNLTTLNDKIEHGLFVHSAAKARHFRVIPPPHKRFTELRPKIQELFIRCFSEGHHNPELRPSPDEWCSVISGRTLIVTERPLPSRVLSLSQVGYTPATSLRSTLSPVSASQIKPVPLPAKPPAKFSGNNVVDYIFLGIGGVASYLILKSLFITILVGLVAMRLTYSLRAEVSTKGSLRKKLRHTSTTMLKKRLKIDRLRNEIGHINKDRKSEIAAFEKKQSRLLGAERNEMEKVRSDYRTYIGQRDVKAFELYKQEEEEVKALMETYKEFNEISEQKFDQEKSRLKTAIRDINQRIVKLEKADLDNENNIQDVFLDELAQELKILQTTKENKNRKVLNETNKELTKQNKILQNIEQNYIKDVEGEMNRKIRVADMAIHELNKRLGNNTGQKRGIKPISAKDYMTALTKLKEDQKKVRAEAKAKKAEIPNLVAEKSSKIQEKKNLILIEHSKNLKKITEEYEKKKAKLMSEQSDKLIEKKVSLQSRKAELIGQLEKTNSIMEAYENQKIDFDAKREIIKERYDELHRQLIQESEGKHQQIEDMLKGIKDNTEKENNHLMQTTALVPIQTQKYIEIHQKETEQLKILNQQYSFLEQDFKSYDDITFWNYVGKILSGK